MCHTYYDREKALALSARRSGETRDLTQREHWIQKFWSMIVKKVCEGPKFFERNRPDRGFQ